MNRNKIISIALAISVFIAFVIAFLTEPFSQPTSYHNFSDHRTILKIPNFWNVVTNIPFFIVGSIGLLKLIINKKQAIVEDNKIAYYLFYFGIVLVAFGSGYYHWYPNNQTLVWDRLPMTIAFMSLFSIIIAEFISAQLGKSLLIPFILTGIFSVIYWAYTESNGKGNLNYYAIVQFYPIITIPIIISLFPSSYNKSHAYWLLLLTYLLAKASEHYDSEIYSVLGFISGHSLKHLIAAFGLYIVLYTYDKRNIKK